jgi:hypothetical protein
MDIMLPVRNATLKEALAPLIYVPAMDVITSNGAALSNKRALYFDTGLKQVSLLIEPRYRIRICDGYHS